MLQQIKVKGIKAPIYCTVYSGIRKSISQKIALGNRKKTQIL